MTTPDLTPDQAAGLFLKVTGQVIPAYTREADGYITMDPVTPEDPRFWGPLLIALMERRWEVGNSTENGTASYSMDNKSGEAWTATYATLPAAIIAAAKIELGMEGE